MKSPAINQAMNILRELRAISEASHDIPEKMEKIVAMIAQQMGADASACYVVVDDNYLELFASCGFNPGMAHKISVPVGEGLVGEVVQTGRSLIVADVWKHPSFSYKPDIGEEPFKSFIGVPLIRWNRAIGVIALQKKEVYEYSRTELEVLETVAMVLTDMVASEEMIDYKNQLIKLRGQSSREKYKGLSLSKGYGIGNAVVHRRRQAVTKIFAEDKEKELKRLEVANTKMNADLDEKFNSTKLGIGEHVDILDAYRMFAKDKGWYKKVSDNVNSGLTAEAAVERAYEDMWNRLSGTKDAYMRERLHDLRDVADRLIGYLNGDQVGKQSARYENLVVVAQTMGPADLMDYDYTKIRGLVIEDGTPTMHVAIVAKALGIPVVAKINGIYNQVKSGELLALDGDEGYVYIRPSSPVQERFKAKIREKEQLKAKLAALKKLPSKTLDGADKFVPQCRSGL